MTAEQILNEADRDRRLKAELARNKPHSEDLTRPMSTGELRTRMIDIERKLDLLKEQIFWSLLQIVILIIITSAAIIIVIRFK